ncbi:hypothetical protein K8R33_01730 [archaeon]|nr:hypothetical protein [archaeon]
MGFLGFGSRKRSGSWNSSSGETLSRGISDCKRAIEKIKKMERETNPNISDVNFQYIRRACGYCSSKNKLKGRLDSAFQDLKSGKFDNARVHLEKVRKALVKEGKNWRH